jgi:hypothetical protein
MAEITVQEITYKGLVMTYEEPETVSFFYNTGSCFVFVRNTSASAITVSVSVEKECEYGFIHPLYRTVEASEQCIILLSPGRFNNSEGKTTFTCSAVADIEVAVGKVVE